MKTLLFVSSLSLLAACAMPFSAGAMVFTSDTTIGLTDFTFEGQDLVVSNAVLTVDGPHAFNSLRVAAGATLTHTATNSGGFYFAAAATNEAHLLTATNPVALANMNAVLASVLVRDTNAVITYTNEVDYELTVIGLDLTVRRTANSAIADGDPVLVSYDFLAMTNAGLNLTLTNDFDLEAGAFVYVDGRGFGGGQGPGRGGTSGSPSSGGGGGNGGFGGVSSSGGAGGAAYDPTIALTRLGSGGGASYAGVGGAGGGAVQINAGGHCVLNGLITADGANAISSRAGGGSGGSIWISAPQISGAGTLRARGGAGEPVNGGGGGGGRIALFAQTNLFTGSALTHGGTGWQRGGAGTFYVQTSNDSAFVTIDNGGSAGASTPLDFLSPAIPTLELRGRAAGLVPNSELTFSNLIVRSNSTLTTLATNNGNLALTINGDMLIEIGATVSLDGKGYPPNSGPGVGATGSVGGGAGHGGYGGSGVMPTAVSAGGNYYDTHTTPAQPGSGGRTSGAYPAGGGGGVVNLTVNGELRLDGKISANGTAGAGLGGGGSGGSVRLTLGTFSGGGSISVNGGAGGPTGNGGGGGAGGRLAVTCDTNLFAGQLTAFGGAGGMHGSAGTVYTKLSNATYGDLRVDNDGTLAGTNTVLDTGSLLNLDLTGGAQLRSTITSFSLGTLNVGSNSTLRLGSTPTQITLTVASNAVIAAGGALVGDGLGFPAGAGTGAGQSSSSGSSGAGHGGYGGRGAGPVSAGNAYDSTTSPTQAGSGGGNYLSGGGAGGAGWRMTVNGSLLLDGRISVNGLGATNSASGGGAGGSLWLTVKDLFSGSGAISADGGSGGPLGGGGGGGRIAALYGTNTFTGTFSAKGGLGFQSGGAGTIFLKPNSANYGSVTLDNAGIPASAGTSVSELGSVSNLTLRSGTVLTSSISSLTIYGDLQLDSGATWFAPSTITVSGAANIANNARISADGYGSVSSGNGQGNFSGSGGGGHGGYGGRGLSGLGGNIYDSTSAPTLPGSQGGYYTYPPIPGGGIVRMTVTGPMTVNGKITANGGSATTNNAAGGSGGTIYLTLNNRLAGSGLISADGGNGQLPNNGGGGGGRIAIIYSSNLFTGTLSAKGGSGYQAGGAGTIYLKRNNSKLPDLLVDNGGQSGTNTVLDVSSLSNLTITGGAILRTDSRTYNVSASALTIGTNSSLQTPTAGSGLTLSLSGPAIIAAGGSISADGLGNGSGVGLGAGISSSLGSGGGSHGGFGGRGVGAAGGNAFDTLTSPTGIGSGGGGVNSSGGTGGGAIRINVTGYPIYPQTSIPFTLDGRISANGANAVSNYAGGGSGGSVWISLGPSGVLQGKGAITANGGDGHLPNGGGGGGGRVSVSYSFTKGNYPSNAFSGTFSARGGNGFVRGGAGTIYLVTNNATPIVIVDNGGNRGTNTSVAGTSGFDLHVQGGAQAMNLGSPRDLFVRANSAVVQAGNLNITRNALFDSGGGLNLDGVSSSGSGNGSTQVSPRGGGGHGGYGADNLGRSSGGVYDSATSPTQSGSKGGNGSGINGIAPDGGFGGGATHLTVGNALTLNGEISADGANGDYNSGGGSGGAVWLEAPTFAGNGAITATGGNGNGTAGGGGGGRVAIYFTTNLFTGTVSACGGDGHRVGGAGTIYWRDGLLRTSLLLDNCGTPGTNTPLASSSGLATNITVTGGAVGEFQGAIPAFSNLLVSAGGWITSRSMDTNLDLALLGDLTVGSDGGISVDGKGYARSAGLGAGGTLFGQGAGGSHGGWGGDSASGAYSGPDYGSAIKPVHRGSGGGAGSGPVTGGSQGGGAIRLAVAGTLSLDGVMSADGDSGWQDDSGGGAGGSVWISARKFTGHGEVVAAGGDGDFYNGGGGGGGRVAIYSPMNTFTGLVSVAGGFGAFDGEAGSIFTSGGFSGLEVVSQSPTGVLFGAVSQVTLEFSEALNPLSITTNDLKLFTPHGALAASDLSWTLPGPATLQIHFPPQNVPGNYRLEVGPFIEGFLAPRMSQVYTGAFTAVLPLLSGTVTDTNGAPVAGVKVQPSGGLMPATSDTNGNYALAVPLNWTGTVTPSLGNFMFVPGARSYADVSGDATNQNYLMVTSIAASLNLGRNGPTAVFNWQGLPGVTYQLYYATNLSEPDWTALGAPMVGTNGPMQCPLPISSDPEMYFRLQAQN